jgi:hypothetical protein
LVLQHLNWYANSSAYAHWVILGLLIPFVNWNLASWLKGIVLAILLAIPVIILTFENGFGQVLPILVASAVLGAPGGVAGEKYVCRFFTYILPMARKMACSDTVIKR